MVGMSSSPILKQKRSWTWHFLRTRLLHFNGLNSILAPAMILHKSSGIHLPSGTDLTVIISSSINALTEVCLMPLARTTPLLSFSTALTRRFIAAENRITETIHPVTMSFSKHCQLMVKSAQVNHILEVPLQNLWTATWIRKCYQSYAVLKKVKYWFWINYSFNSGHFKTQIPGQTYEGVDGSSLILFLFNPVFFVVKSLSVSSSFTNLLNNKKM